MIYEGFRRFLVKNLRIYDRNDVIHVMDRLRNIEGGLDLLNRYKYSD